MQCTPAEHIQLNGVSHLTRIIWSNHLEDYAVIITYLSKLHSNSANCNIHMVISFVLFLFYSLNFIAAVAAAVVVINFVWRNVYTSIQLQFAEHYAVACARTVATAVTMRNEWQKRSAV